MFVSYNTSTLLGKVKVGYVCPNCNTRYDTQAEVDACSKQSGCPEYEEIEAVITSDDE